MEKDFVIKNVRIRKVYLKSLNMAAAMDGKSARVYLEDLVEKKLRDIVKADIPSTNLRKKEDHY